MALAGFLPTDKHIVDLVERCATQWMVTMVRATSSVAGSGPVPVLSPFLEGLGTKDRTGLTTGTRTRTGTGTAVLRGPERTAVRSSVRTGPGPKASPYQS